jgi:hypothetical protein
MRVMDTLKSYERVIADLQSVKTDESIATIDVLEHRVSQIQSIYAVELEFELAELEASKSRHPATRRKTEKPADLRELEEQINLLADIGLRTEEMVELYTDLDENKEN